MSTILNKIEREKREEHAYKKMLAYGWKPHQASAIVGNLMRESNLNTTIVGTADDKGSQGVAQWHSGRLTNLKNKYGKNWTDFDNQLEFVDWELRNTHKSAGIALKQTNGVWDAGRVFTDKYEAPKVKWNSDKKRQTYVTDNYRKFSKIPLTAEDTANFIRETTQRVSDNYHINQPQANFPTTQTPEISSLVKPIETYNFVEQEKADKEQEFLAAKIDLQNKQNEENLFQDLLKASQLQYVDPNQVENEDYTQQEEQTYQEGGIVKDDNGYWNPENWGKPVEINSNLITMQGVGQPLWGVSNQTGERKLMIPGVKNYRFKNTQQVTEYPLN